MLGSILVMEVGAKTTKARRCSLPHIIRLLYTAGKSNRCLPRLKLLTSPAFRFPLAGS